MNHPTLRSLARRLRLSVATVSEALRQSPRVRPATRERVCRAALKAGYEVNPLLGAALSAVRRGRHRDYRGVLALIDTDEENEAQYLPFHREIAAGAAERALNLGFQTELFWLGEVEPALTLKRMPGVLHARGINGAILLPFHTTQDLSEFDFSRLAAVQMDHCLIRPQLHTILPDHFISMTHSLERIAARGYRRIGLCLEQRKDSRIKGKWSAAYHSFVLRHPDQAAIPALITAVITRENFLAWHRRHRPEIMVGHIQAMVDWLQESGVRVPEDTAFFNLNLTERTAPCAGLDLAPRRLGAAAVETVVAMLHRQERGVPAFPQTITLEAIWTDGPTLASQPRARISAAPAGGKTSGKMFRNCRRER